VYCDNVEFREGEYADGILEVMEGMMKPLAQ